jgi:hypothetical protein
MIIFLSFVSIYLSFDSNDFCLQDSYSNFILLFSLVETLVEVNPKPVLSPEVS